MHPQGGIGTPRSDVAHARSDIPMSRRAPEPAPAPAIPRSDLHGILELAPGPEFEEIPAFSAVSGVSDNRHLRGLELGDHENGVALGSEDQER